MTEENNSRIMEIMALLKEEEIFYPNLKEQGELFFSPTASAGLGSFLEKLDLTYTPYAFGTDGNGDGYNTYREAKTGKEYLITRQARGIRIVRTS